MFTSPGTIIVLVAALVAAAAGDTVPINPPDITPPTVAGIVHSDPDNLIVVGVTLTYTVEFDEAIDPKSVSVADFGNAGTATVIIGGPVPQGDRTFQIPVTPTSHGTIRLKVSGVITDALGNALVVPVVAPASDAVTVNGPAWRNAATPDPLDVALTGTAREKLIRDLYAKVLGREVPDNDVTGWVARFHKEGMTPQVLADNFWFSPEHRTRQAHHFHIRFLGRAAEPAEAQRWANAMINGMSEREAAVAMLTSPEFTKGLTTNAAYITQLYRTLLDRTPSAVEVDGWISTGQSRAELARSLLTCEEFGLTVLNNYYEGYLGRPIDPASRSHFLRLFMSRKSSEADIARAILGSHEFFVNPR